MNKRATKKTGQELLHTKNPQDKGKHCQSLHANIVSKFQEVENTACITVNCNNSFFKLEDTRLFMQIK